MEVRWQYAKDLLYKLEKPDYGTTESWSSWYEQSWTHLAKAGLTTVATPLDLTRIKLRIAATCWLSLDFVAAMQSNDYCNTFYWSDWIRKLQIDPTWAMATAIDDQGMREVIENFMNDSGIVQEVFDDDEIILYDDNGSDLCKNLDEKVVATAAEMQRELVCSALIDQLGGSQMLFLALYTACVDIDRLVEERKDEMESVIDELRDDLDYALSVAQEEVNNSAEHQERIDRLRSEITCREGHLDDGSIRETIMEQLRDRAFEAVSPFGWDDDVERIKAFEWCHSGCEIINMGEG
jgi:hypothetical protein